MSSATQKERRLEIETPLGKDVLMLESFSGQEEMSRLFSYDLHLLSARDDIKPDEIVGKNVTFWVEYHDGSDRYFNGYVNRFSFLGTGDRLSIYRAQVVPWLWFLTRASDCRIFQNQTVPDIVKDVFTKAGFQDKFKVKSVSGDHPSWEYCVQYRETHFNFVSRLLEHEGIFYYFEHEHGKHTLVLSDQTAGYVDAKENQVHLREKLSAGNPLSEILSWEHQYDYRSGKWSQTDYNFETPSNNLFVQTSSKVKLEGNDKLEFYDYPGEYEVKGDGQNDLKLRMEEEETSYNVVSSTSTCRSFHPGAKFKLVEHHADEEKDQGYVVTAVHHSATGGGSFVSGGTGLNTYSNSFTCIPDDTLFRPARLTPKPMIHGIQTALVVGPKGEEIYTDKYGRIKVQFYWDRLGKKDEKSSCFIRVAQMSAGKGWVRLAIPRVGQEVVVTYLEGDPDRPLVTGVVYNAEQMPAYTLPDEKTKSYIKSNSSKGGQGYNEIRLEDKAGQEQIFIHAQQNMDTRVLKDSMTAIIGNRNLIVGKDDKTGNNVQKVWNQNLNWIVGGASDYYESDYFFHAGMGDNGGDVHYTAAHNEFRSIQENSNTTVGTNRSEQVGGNQSLSVSGNQDEQVGGNYSMGVGGQLYINAGATLVIEAGTKSPWSLAATTSISVPPESPSREQPS